jgi:hypothetical protein
MCIFLTCGYFVEILGEKNDGSAFGYYKKTA